MDVINELTRTYLQRVGMGLLPGRTLAPSQQRLRKCDAVQVDRVALTRRKYVHVGSRLSSMTTDGQYYPAALLRKKHLYG